MFYNEINKHAKRITLVNTMRLSGTLALDTYMASLLAFCLDLLQLSDLIMQLLMLDDTLTFLNFALLTMFEDL